MTTRAELEQAVENARNALTTTYAALNNFNALAENNQYETIEQALNSVEDQLVNMAHKACESAGDCGLDEYTQEFMVDDITYLGNLAVEYNRHDKTYYYVDGQTFSFVILY